MLRFVFIVLMLQAKYGEVISRELETVSDDDLVHLIKTEDNVVVLFTKTNCKECESYEIVLENIQEDVRESLDAVVVRAHNSPMASVYDPTKEPSLIYFRRGIPLLYYGKVGEDEILHTFSTNRDPVVKELSDKNFEHLTQASTGATTGDWFIFFYSIDCVFCQRLYAVWEAVGAALKQRMNVARVNRLEAGISTGKRFDIKKSPEFILLRQGKFYRYKSLDYTPESFIKFVEGGYVVDKGEIVPPINSMNEFLSSWYKVVVDSQHLVLIGIGFTLFFAILIKFLRSKSDKKTQKTKKAK